MMAFTFDGVQEPASAVGADRLLETTAVLATFRDEVGPVDPREFATTGNRRGPLLNRGVCESGHHRIGDGVHGDIEDKGGDAP
jgi:hypothetical protein